MFKSVMEIENEVNNYGKNINLETLREHSNRMHIYMLCDLEIKKMDNYSLSSKNAVERHTREEYMRPLRQEITNLQDKNGLNYTMK